MKEYFGKNLEETGTYLEPTRKPEEKGMDENNKIERDNSSSQKISQKCYGFYAAVFYFTMVTVV